MHCGCSQRTTQKNFKLRKGECFGPVEQFFLALDSRVPRLREKASALLFRAQLESDDRAAMRELFRSKPTIMIAVDLASRQTPGS